MKKKKKKKEEKAAAEKVRQSEPKSKSHPMRATRGRT